jgi:hypothetical protein
VGMGAGGGWRLDVTGSRGVCLGISRGLTGLCVVVAGG